MIGGNKRENGLYLSKFETREEAREYIEQLANRYRYTPNQKTMSIRKLVAEAEKEGVELNRTTLGKWFRELGVEIRNVAQLRGSFKSPHTFSLSDELIEVIDEYPNKSYLAELGLRLVTRMPIEDVVIFFPEEENEDPINAIFEKKPDGKIKATVTGKLNSRDKKHIKKILDLANEKGIDVVKEYARMFDFNYVGGE